MKCNTSLFSWKVRHAIDLALVLILLAASNRPVEAEIFDVVSEKPSTNRGVQVGYGVLEFEMLDPNGTPTGQWDVNASVRYLPIELNKRTTKTKWHLNCNSRSHFPIPELPRPCRRVYTREVVNQVAASEIRLINQRTAQLTVPTRKMIRRDEYRLQEIELSMKLCHDGCDRKVVKIGITCMEEFKVPEIISLPLAIRYVSDEVGSNSGALYYYKADSSVETRSEIVDRIRGHFPPNEAAISKTLIEGFDLIPLPNGTWRRNPTSWMLNRDFQNMCPSSSSTYTRKEFRFQFGKRPALPMGGQVRAIAYLREKGEVCGINIRYEMDRHNYDYYFDFSNGKLAQVRGFEGPRNSSAVWRFDNGIPTEFVRRTEHSPVQGETEVWYWHSIVAAAWPEKMSFTPDMRVFVDLQVIAKELELEAQRR